MATGTHLQIVIFKVTGEEYALPIDRVQEIIRYTPPRPLDVAAAWVRGVISLRGAIIPVYDLAARLGLPGSGDDAHSEIVIVEGPERTIGLVVDDVEEVHDVELDQVERLPVGGDAFRGIAKLDGGRLVAILDPDAVFALAGAADAGDVVPVAA
jgi:purine-binding chemotaxis protein CheW